MNRTYTIITLFVIASLLAGSVPVPSDAASNLGYMLTIAENAKKYCKSQIEARETVEPKMKELYLESISEIDKLESAIDASDTKSAREHFVSAMQKMRQISLMINQLEITEVDQTPTIRNPILDRYEMNIQKLKSISIKLGADIDFHEIDELMNTAKQTHTRGDVGQTKQLIENISKKGNAIYQTLKTINEENKIVRAKALAEKYSERINVLILQAKQLGLEDSVNKLEQTKNNLISANTTSQIRQNIKIIIVVSDFIQKSKVESMDDIQRADLQLSKQQQAQLMLNQLEKKASTLSADSDGNNVAIYYLDKIQSLIKSAKLQLDDPSNDIDSKIKQIERLLLKVERLLHQAT
tara:strand:+ start:447 stop:1505 length:1059 start_codon:yes stop_codon:yes gene_type:complete